MKSYLKALAIVSVIISLAACTPNKTEKFRECYRDEIFIAMLNDSMYKHQEEEIQERNSIVFYASFEQPLLWNDNGDTTLRKMVDYYNYRAFENSIYTDIDTWVCFGREGIDYEAEMLDSWQKIMLSGLSNTSMRRRLKKTLKDCFSEKIDVDIFVDINDDLSTWTPKVDSALFEDILCTIQPQCFLPAYFKNNYHNYVGRGAQPDSIMKADLYLTYQSEQNYDTRCAMLFMLIGVPPSGETLKILINDAEEILTSGQYTPLLPLLWRAYRVAYCHVYCCPSIYCEIPNVRFNYYRRLVAYTYLRHIEKNPDDITAKIQYFMLASYENINRFGLYPFGNQRAEEWRRLYYCIDSVL